MADISPSSAINDLLWLQTRFKGILEILPKLEEVGGLENYLAELQKSIADAKGTNADLLAAKEALSKSIADAKLEASKIVESASNEAKAIVAEAKAAASAAQAAANVAAGKEAEELARLKAQKEAELAALDDAIAAAKAEVESKTSQYEALSNLIEELKAKIL